MALSRSVFTVLLLCVVCKASNVPVFLWGDLSAPNLKANPLTVTTSPAFSDILSQELSGEPLTVIFIEETLSNEDFSRRNADGETSFPYLHSNLGKSVYLPSVENPIEALNLLEDPEEVSFVTLTEDGLSSEILPNSGNVLFINLKDAKDGESRGDMLQRHNDIMEDIVSKLQESHKSVVAVYTALQPSWVVSHSRFRRQAVDSNNTNEYALDGLRLYAKKIILVDDNKITSLEELSSSSSELNSTATTLKTTLQFSENSIVLSFRGAGGYWFFVVFGDSFHCVGFFSAPIWSGLFVVFILLSITFYGILMMMDIRTMDRFDDPKGKTITINAGE
ncbi:putative vacuolar ATP synthase subunit S1 [Operophtera brumata]|uniref:Putative vacuolar ATP synthase subunit S1 n=1 Tax=Operophtera brumata TaxID=104452 RepID=A0A0L7LJ85_OPEBR|nr:putative vacuolar ATP synthase subunit S1 [Operophtera brumata]